MTFEFSCEQCILTAYKGYLAVRDGPCYGWKPLLRCYRVCTQFSVVFDEGLTLMVMKKRARSPKWGCSIVGQSAPIDA